MSDFSVPFFRPTIEDDEISQVEACLRSGWLTTGPNAKAFEAEFSALMNNADCLAVTSATAALHLGLDALGVEPDDEVIVPTLTFTATAEVVRYMGAKPIFVDVDPKTLCLDINAIEGLITKKTKVIIPVHFGGRSCDMTALRALADKYNIFIMDDAAHALPTRHKNKLIGTTGADITAFSFYANKTMTTGEGGMLVMQNKEFAKRARIMRLHGIDRDVFNRFTDTNASWVYDVVAPGFKYNMTDIAAALGRVQFSKIDRFCSERTKLAKRYFSKLKDLPLILPPEADINDTHSWHLFIIRLTDDAPVNRDDLIQHLQKNNIGSSVHYRPLHQMTYWSKIIDGRKFPEADKYFNHCLSLPLYMSMTHEEQNYVIDVLHKVLG